MSDKVKWRDIEVEKGEQESVEILPEAIQEEYVRIPADLAYWNARYARALKAHLKAKARIDRLEALLGIEHRQRLQDEGSKATEAAVKAAVENDERLHQAQDDAIEAEVEKARLWGVVDAVRAKKDMLVSLGAHLRAEIGDDPLVKKAAADMRAARRGA